jgi:hypothetical protein
MNSSPRTVSPFVLYLFMAIGLISAIAFRLVTIVNAVNPGLMRPVWYAGVIGYIFFFAYRYHITAKRKRAIRVHHLLEKIRHGGEISGEDRAQIEYVLSSVARSREHVNYLFIFLLSIVAVVVDILLAAGG